MQGKFSDIQIYVGKIMKNLLKNFNSKTICVFTWSFWFTRRIYDLRRSHQKPCLLIDWPSAFLFSKPTKVIPLSLMPKCFCATTKIKTLSTERTKLFNCVFLDTMYANMSLSFATCESHFMRDDCNWRRQKDPNLSVLMHHREIKKD